MNRKSALTAIGLLAAALLSGCSAPKLKDADHRKRFEAKAAVAKEQFEKEYSDIAKKFDSAAGYAIFPTIGQGGWGLGLGFGEGLVYKKGDLVGTAGNSVVTIGFQFGGQALRKVVFFNTDAVLDAFTTSGGNLDFAAEANAVFGPWGASADGTGRDSVEVYTVQRGGLMYEAAIGAQYYDYRALD